MKADQSVRAGLTEAADLRRGGRHLRDQQARVREVDQQWLRQLAENPQQVYAKAVQNTNLEAQQAAGWHSL